MLAGYLMAAWGKCICNCYYAHVWWYCVVCAHAVVYSSLNYIKLHLLQYNGQVWRPVTYASRTLSNTERRYAQIEKEALATMQACEKFSTYILRQPFSVETDHKPLVPLLNSKHLDDLPPRVLRFQLRLAKYGYVAHHVPGKYLYAADALSRAPTTHMQVETEEVLQEEVEAYVNSITICPLSLRHCHSCKGTNRPKWKITSVRSSENTV